MPRELRPRKSRASYSQLDVESSSNAGPSRVQILDEENNGNDLVPQGTSTRNEDDNDDDDFDSDMHVHGPVARALNAGLSSISKSPSSWSSSKRPKLATTARPSTSKPPQTVTTTPMPPPQVPPRRTTKMYTLPNLSAHHRHRAIPVYHRREDVERLEHAPALFEEPKIAFTKSMTASQSLTDRIGKAWGYSVGPGPVWDILEDRSCFKESVRWKDDPRKEASRRPRVYTNLLVRPGWQVLDYQCVIRRRS